MTLDFIGGLVIGLACCLTGLLIGCVLTLWMFRDEDEGGGDWNIEELDPDPEPSVHA